MRWSRLTSFHVLPNDETAWSILGKCVDGSVFSEMTICCAYNHALKLWAESAEVSSRVSLHFVRHTFAAMALSAGTTITVVRDMLGHASVKETEIYVTLSVSFP